MKLTNKILPLLVAVMLSACAADGSYWQADKNQLDLEQTVLRVGGTGLVVGSAVACAGSDGCTEAVEKVLTGALHLFWSPGSWSATYTIGVTEEQA